MKKEKLTSFRNGCVDRLKCIPLERCASACLLFFCLLVVVTPAAAQKTATAGGDSHYASLDKMRIHYQSYGKGSEALVLIHGWTCNIDNWTDQLPDFAKRGRVIAIDLPGHGRSDKPEVTYSMDLFARGVDAVRRDAGGQRRGLIGHSLG